MRTIRRQFEIMIDYMERYGDIHKAGGGLQERLANVQHWEKLTKALNSVTGGHKKSLDKWKKVWSDLKCKIKNKGKVYKKASQNGVVRGRKLSNLEQRVLDLLMKTQAVTGLPEEEEVGCEQVTAAAPVKQSIGPSSYNDTTPTVLIENSLENEDLYVKENGQYKLLSAIEVEGSSSHSRESVQDESHISPRVSPSPTVVRSRRRSTSQRKSVSPSPVVMSRRRSTLQRRAKPIFPRSDTAPGHSASRYFFESDERWRSLFNKMATEHFRLRNAELKQQAQWQVLFDKMITILNKFVE